MDWSWNNNECQLLCASQARGVMSSRCDELTTPQLPLHTLLKYLSHHIHWGCGVKFEDFSRNAIQVDPPPPRRHDWSLNKTGLNVNSPQEKFMERGVIVYWNFACSAWNLPVNERLWICINDLIERKYHKIFRNTNDKWS